MDIRQGTVAAPAVPCSSCGGPATVWVTSPHSKAAPDGWPACDAHRPARQQVASLVCQERPL